tara:strand:+ start:45 stop:296 length:252 start_codon:yes stop_codon:yes gene_type:complete
MKTFKLSHDHIGFIGFQEYEYTTAVRALHEMIENEKEWLQDFPKGKWTVELFNDETWDPKERYKVLYTLTTAKIKKLQKDGLF